MLLCVDDNAAMREYVRALLEESGYIVVTSASARLGLRFATVSRFDAVLLDYHMQELNGHHFVQEIRRARPETVVIMLSAADIPEETSGLVDAGVRKPEVVTQLLPTVERLCDGPPLAETGPRPG